MFKIRWFLLLLLLLLLLFQCCWIHALSSTPMARARAQAARLVSQSKSMVLDGAAYASLEPYVRVLRRNVRTKGTVGQLCYTVGYLPRENWGEDDVILQKKRMEEEEDSDDDKRRIMKWNTKALLLQEDVSRNKVLAVPIGSEEDDVIEEEEDRIVELADGVKVYASSICQIPDSLKSVSNAQLLDTALSCLPLYCATCLKEQNIGGSSSTSGNKSSSNEDNDDGIPTSGLNSDFPARVVVMGGGEYANFMVDALDIIGADVTWITTQNGVKARREKVNISGPAMTLKPSSSNNSSKALELPFCVALRTFDALIDTIGDERNIGKRDNDEDMSVRSITTTTAGSNRSNRIVDQLDRQHQCQNYISTYSRAQRMVRDNGLIFGPGKAKKYENALKNVFTDAKLKSALTEIVPPPDYASRVLAPLFESNFLYKTPGTFQATKDMIIRTWSVKDFWECSTWPREVEGAFTRFGLPEGRSVEQVYDENDEEDDEDVTEELSKEIASSKTKSKQKPAPKGTDSSTRNNPFILDIDGVDDLESTIMNQKQDALIFLSAPFCRTCRFLYPRYARMARMGKDQHQGELIFAKADAIGRSGKQLGKYLGVQAVPSFVLFRNGEIYGRPLAVSKLPSKKLNRAIEYLRSGLEWNDGLFRFMDEAEKRETEQAVMKRDKIESKKANIKAVQEDGKKRDEVNIKVKESSTNDEDTIKKDSRVAKNETKSEKDSISVEDKKKANAKGSKQGDSENEIDAMSSSIDKKAETVDELVNDKKSVEASEEVAVLNDADLHIDTAAEKDVASKVEEDENNKEPESKETIEPTNEKDESNIDDSKEEAKSVKDNNEQFISNKSVNDIDTNADKDDVSKGKKDKETKESKAEEAIVIINESRDDDEQTDISKEVKFVEAIEQLDTSNDIDNSTCKDILLKSEEEEEDNDSEKDETTAQTYKDEGLSSDDKQTFVSEEGTKLVDASDEPALSNDSDFDTNIETDKDIVLTIDDEKPDAKEMIVPSSKDDESSSDDKQTERNEPEKSVEASEDPVLSNKSNIDVDAGANKDIVIQSNEKDDSQDFETEETTALAIEDDVSKSDDEQTETRKEEEKPVEASEESVVSKRTSTDADTGADKVVVVHSEEGSNANDSEKEETIGLSNDDDVPTSDNKHIKISKQDGTSVERSKKLATSNDTDLKVETDTEKDVVAKSEYNNTETESKETIANESSSGQKQTEVSKVEAKSVEASRGPATPSETDTFVVRKSEGQETTVKSNETSSDDNQTEKNKVEDKSVIGSKELADTSKKTDIDVESDDRADKKRKRRKFPRWKKKTAKTDETNEN